ncbi:MAG TPA: hypothetical protein VFE16_05350 [Candidatus Cybelea sp.]|jgi:hypothetical protein|nr:hypothetical protein [Candidatus Cybelea sp.]
MRFLQPILIAAAIAVVSAGAAVGHSYNGADMRTIAPDSHSYSGSWPVTISRAKAGNGTFCLTLTQNGRNGGSASFVEGSEKFAYGTFQIFNHTLVATIEAQGYGQNAGLVFIGSANHGTIGPGVFDEVYGGEAFDEGALAFGMKGGC